MLVYVSCLELLFIFTNYFIVKQAVLSDIKVIQLWFIAQGLITLISAENVIEKCSLAF